MTFLETPGKRLKMSGPGPLRYRRSRRRRNGPTGIPIAEAQTSLGTGARIRFFHQSRRTKRVTFCESISFPYTVFSKGSWNSS